MALPKEIFSVAQHFPDFICECGHNGVFHSTEDHTGRRTWCALCHDCNEFKQKQKRPDPKNGVRDRYQSFIGWLQRRLGWISPNS